MMAHIAPSFLNCHNSKSAVCHVIWYLIAVVLSVVFPPLHCCRETAMAHLVVALAISFQSFIRSFYITFCESFIPVDICLIDLLYPACAWSTSATVASSPRHPLLLTCPPLTSRCGPGRPPPCLPSYRRPTVRSIWLLPLTQTPTQVRGP